jgi:single-strand DNA-binding protein
LSDGINRVTLLGNLGADPELRQTQGGAVLNLRLATTETWIDKDKEKRERTDWHSVTLWGKRGEALAAILRKGSQLLVEGRLSTSSYEKDGQKRYKTEIVASNVVLCGGKPGDSRERSGAPAANLRAPAQPANIPDFGETSGNPVDDIPF